ncbi:PAS domain S-box protein [Allosphingosinicella deserti]|uniref:histidine kinase n=1 Tax=Allosphingosinicella deserti TaxID=2116704 RepID=A0A2P7QNR7_9SPHN|nr:PAS domain S-box protein [Sphingomonas deserti]PSJ39615.1 histidine kinase [Sphingomonas deserti]
MTAADEFQDDQSADATGTAMPKAALSALAIDYRTLFDAAPTPLLVVAPPEWIIIAANDARLEVTGTTREATVGRRLFDVFPDDPDDPAADGARNLAASLERVVATGAADIMPIQRYAVKDADGTFVERWWSPINTPVLAPDGRLTAVMHQVADITDIIKLRGEAAASETLARDRQSIIDRLRIAGADLLVMSARKDEILESISDAFYAVDREWRFTYVNRKAEEMWGRAREALLGNVFWDEFPQAVGSEAHQAHLRASADRTVVQLETISPVLGRWIDASIYPTKDGGLSVYFRDIADKKRAEEAQRASEEFNRRILSASADCIKVLSLDARLEFMSEGGMCVMEVDDFDAIQGSCWTDFWTGEEHAKAVAAVEEAKRGGTGRFQGFATTMKGSPRWWDVIVSPINGRDGAPEKLLSVSRDVTAARLADERERASEARYRQIVEGAEDFAIVSVDEHGVVTGWNRGAERITGFSPDEAIGRAGDFFFTPEDKAQGIPDHELNRAMSDGRSLNERWHLRKDGGRFWGSGLTMRLDQPGGGYLKIFRDRTSEHEAEAAVRESEARFRLMADAVPQIVWITDAAGRAEFFNRQWTDYTGIPYEPTTAAAVAADHVHPDDQAPTIASFEESLRTGKTFSVEHRIRSRTGEYRWFLVRGEPHHDPDTGEILRWFGASVDIHDRKEAEARLQDNEERLRLATEAAEVGFWDVDLVNNLLIWPPRLKAMFGISPDVPVTMADFYGGLHPDDRQRVGAAFTAACDPAKRALYDVEYRTIGREDGVVRWISAKGRGRFTAEEACSRVVGTALEITARKADEVRLRELNETLEKRVSDRTAELSESQRRFQGIFNSALQFMALLTPDGIVVEVNETALAWSEIEPGDIIGKPFWRAAPMRDNPALQDAVELGIRRAAAGETVREEHEMRGAGEVRAIVDFSLKPVRAEHGEPIWLVAEGRDITELKQAQEALRQSQKMEAMGQLTGGVAHDFNNLLAPIIGSLDMLTRKGIGNERERRLIDGALQSAERAKTLVQRLLAFARRQPLQAGAVDVKRLVGDMAELIASTSGPNIDVRVELPDDLPPAVADANQLEMAVLNLAVNARDAMPEGGVLAISAARASVRSGDRSGLRQGHYIRLSVRDTGTGMDEATLARAVEPFFSTKGIGKGTGLGLSMVHGLALQLNGRLAIASRLGEGTTIDLWLPISSVSADAEDRILREVAPARAMGKALLVDDEDLVRMSTADMLIDMGYEVVEAGSAEEAKRLIEEGLAPDLVVTDHLMPGISGAELAHELRARRPNLPILIISGYADAEGIEAGLPRLTKPFRSAELAASLAALKPGVG